MTWATPPVATPAEPSWSATVAATAACPAAAPAAAAKPPQICHSAAVGGGICFTTAVIPTGGAAGVEEPAFAPPAVIPSAVEGPAVVLNLKSPAERWALFFCEN